MPHLLYFAWLSLWVYPSLWSSLLTSRPRDQWGARVASRVWGRLPDFWTPLPQPLPAALSLALMGVCLAVLPVRIYLR